MGDMAMNVAYALLWLPVGFLLRAASNQKPKIVLGLPTPMAAVLAMILQWTVGSLLLVVVFVVSLSLKDQHQSYLDIWNTMYGTVFYHWGMLLILYCLHNLSYGLTIRYDGDYDSDDDDDNDDDIDDD